MTSEPFSEHHVQATKGKVYVREYAGEGPAFVLMHGFPDNLHIYDDLIPHLVAAGRHVVAFDFVGYGASEKPEGASYTFEQHVTDLKAVIDGLKLDKVVPVTHDASGPAGINYTLAYPERVASLCILNSAYADSASITWPPLVEVFAIKALAELSGAIAEDPEKLGWLLGWQQVKFRDSMPKELWPRFESHIRPLIGANFLQAPSSGPAFGQLAAQFHQELERNAKSSAARRALEVPVKVIWGEYDKYLTADVGKELAASFKTASYSAIAGGHWPQSDLPAEVASALLA